MRKNYNLTSIVTGVITLCLSFAIPQWAHAQTYCTPAYTYVDCSKLQRSVYINSVAFGNRLYTSGCSQAGYSGIVNTLSNGVQDPIVLTSGQYYPIRVGAYDYNYSTYTYSASVNYTVWVDYDRNGTFNNNEERVIYTATANGTQQIYFGENVAGNMRMRIRTQLTSATNDPCAQQDIGETEDYLLKVVPAAPVVANTYAYVCSGSSTQLTATGCNYGTVVWTDGKSDQRTGSSIAVSPSALNQNTAYTATCSQNGVTSLASNPVNIYVSSTSAPTISSSNYNLTVSDPAQTATLTATGCYGTVNWYNSDQPNSPFATGYSNYYYYYSNSTVTTTVAPQKSIRYWSTCTSPYNGCTSSRSNELQVSVNKPNAPTVSSDKQSICPDQSVVLTASCSGTVKWSTNETGKTITVKPSKTTEYGASCDVSGQSSVVSSLTITVNTPISITGQPTSLTACEGAPVALAVSTAGSSSLQYRWSRNGAVLTDSLSLGSQLTFPNATSALAGDYVVSVTGVCGVVQSNPAKVVVSPKMTVTATPTAVSCYGGANGAVAIAVNGGLGAKSYQLTDRAGQSQLVTSFTGLTAGTYPLTIRDAANCSVTATATIASPLPITMTVTSTTASCPGSKDGALMAVAGGGTGAFKYQLGSGASQSDGTFGSLTGGAVYTIQATDANSCTTTITATVQQPLPIAGVIASTPTLCSGSTGSLTVTPSGGTGLKQYKLNTGAYQSGNSFSSLASGSYTVTIKDDKGCEAIVGATVSTTAATQFTASATATDLNCYGDKSAVKVVASGGAGSLQYQLGTTTYQAGDSFAGITAGSYTVNVKDANGCLATTTIAVNQPPLLSAKAAMTQVNCFGDRSGTVTIASSGGTPDRQYQLNGGAFQNENIFRNLSVGTYAVSVKDAKGCVARDSIRVTKADSVKASAVMLQASCCSCPNGTLNITATGGVGTKQAQLGTGPFQELLQFGALAPGTYKIIVKDQDGCTATLNPVVTSASNLSLVFGTITNITCAGGKDGSAAVNIVTGRSPYRFAWSNGDTTAIAAKLPEGEIRLTVTDADKCVATTKTTLTAVNQLPPKPVVALTASGLSIPATSGIQWYSGTTISSGTAIQGATQSVYVPVQSGSYYAIVTANTCASPASDLFNYILTGVFETAATLQVRAYPNPVSGRLYVEVKNPVYTSVRFQLLDLNGHMQHQHNSFPFEGKQVIEINPPVLPSGMYLLRVDAGEQKATLKLIVQ